MRAINLAIMALMIILLVSLFGVILYYRDTVRNKESRISALQLQVAPLQSQIENQTSEIESLNSQISSLKIEIANLTKPSARIVNFTQDDRPVWPVFGATGYWFNLSIQNDGAVTLDNVTVTVKLTLSNGNSSSWSQQISPLRVGETRSISWTIQFNAMYFSRAQGQWLAVITSPEGLLAQQTYQTS